jgi:hypothetical protein
MTVVTNVDPLNFAVCKLQLLKDDIPLSVATGFFHRVTVNDVLTTYLVTNWHVLSGRNSDNPNRPLHKTGALPTRVRLNLVLDTVPSGTVHFIEKFINLYTDEADPRVAQPVPTGKNGPDPDQFRGIPHRKIARFAVYPQAWGSRCSP